MMEKGFGDYHFRWPHKLDAMDGVRPGCIAESERPEDWPGVPD
jgi:hypothetical protein